MSADLNDDALAANERDEWVDENYPMQPGMLAVRNAAREAWFAALSSRWLAEHDREVAATALRDAAQWKREHNLGNDVWRDYLGQLADEKYRAGGDDMVTIWLDDRADRASADSRTEQS